MKIMVDTSIRSGSNFLIPATQKQRLKWGTGATGVTISGFTRRELDPDADQQCEKDALFTIGRLARTGRLTLHTYCELDVESWRGGEGRMPIADPLSHCRFQPCPAAVERSKFRQTLNMNEWIAKGGKKDKKHGITLSDCNQIPFLEWLALLPPKSTKAIIDHGGILKLDDFEVASLQDLSWFQTMTRLLGSSDHLPDCFHLWTARRNGLDAFLTLEKKLPRSIEQIKNRREKAIDLSVAVLRPTELLHTLGIDEIDPVPYLPERFYSYSEIFKIDRQLLKN